MDKASLRAKMRLALRSLRPLDRAMQEELVNAMLLEQAAGAHTVLVYKAKAPELSLVSFTNAAFRSGKKVVMPRVDGDELSLHLVRGWGDLQPGAFGIDEPGPASEVVALEEIQFAAVPGLAWTVSGVRLGQGGGFYDKLLPRLECLKVGIAFDCQIVDHVPVEVHDVAVDDVCFASKLFT